MLLVYLRSFVDCTLSFMHPYDSWHVALEEFCIWGGAFLRSCAAFLPSIFSGGVLVFRGSVWAFYAPFAQLHTFSGSLWVLCFCLSCVEPLPISLGTETFPSQFGIFDASHASDFDIGFYAAFVHLSMSFCLSFDPLMRFSAFDSQTISCALMLSTHSSRGRLWKSSWYESWFDSYERFDKLMKWFWWQFGSSELYEILCVSFALVWDCELCEILYVSLLSC